MKNLKKYLVLTILLTTICFVSISNAQVRESPVEIIERLPDGTIILTIDGAKYRALAPEHLRKIAELRVEYESANAENAALLEQNKLLKMTVQKVSEDVQTADALAKNESRRADEFKKLMEQERDLRLAAEKLPRKKNVFEKILNHPATQIILVAAAGAIAAKN